MCTSALIDPDTYLGSLSVVLARASEPDFTSSAVTGDEERASKRSKATAITLNGNMKSGALAGGKGYDAARERLEEVRLACARNLARAMVDSMDAAW